jgi:hypothetical protein
MQHDNITVAVVSLSDGSIFALYNKLPTEPGRSANILFK